MSEEYKAKCILLTGGAGFIGSCVLNKLVINNPDITVVCLDKLTQCASTNNFKDLLDLHNFVFVKGDIASPDLVNYILEEYSVDTIINFAAETHVDNSFGNSCAFSTTNVLGTHVLLESSRVAKYKIRRFIHVSTDEVYGESDDHAERNRVDAVLRPTNPYSATKAAAEFMVKAYHCSYDLPIIITRGNNVYGPRQYPEKLIPKFISLLSQGKPCPLHGDGSNARSFMHVDDVADAFDIIMRKGDIGKVYNIGSHYEIQNKDVLNKLLNIFQFKDKSKYINYVKDRAFNDFRYHIDTIALENLGWKQKVMFDEGLAATKKWYIDHPDWWPDIAGALKAHPFVQSVQFTKPQKRSSQAGKNALKRQKTQGSQDS